VTATGLSRTALVADSHIGGPGGTGEELFAQLQQLPDQGCDRLVMMGDIFQVWVGDERYETAEIRRLLPILEGLRESGVHLSYIEGNRDFFLADSPYAEFFDQVGFEVSFETGGRRYLAVHGDGLNHRDWRYRFWRWLSKSPPSRFFFCRLPRRLANRIVHTTEQKLGKSNFKHKLKIPEDVIRSYAATRLAEGFDTLILGHFHQPFRWQVAGGEVWILDAWYNDHKIEWIE
jgi:UDP-2,3-diacylglucosamine hydrolase